ncbi:MAG: winged helix-turn-helix transcriptional regulator [Bacillota bacterium]|nr:winged helix-turn-helix transcriptional regulator [Bacillota bacterium]
MANYTNEIAHMIERFRIKTLSQDRDGFFKTYLKLELNLLEVLLLRHLSKSEARINTLVKQLEVSRNLVNTTVSRLVKDKIVQKRTDHKDGRCQIISLTPQGKRLADDLLAQQDSELSFMLRDVTVNEERAILKFLSKYVQYHTERYEPK